MERQHAKLVAMLLLAAAAVAADSVAAAEPEVRCACRNKDGSKYTLGQIACIRVGGVSYLARCEMNLNVLTWRKLRDGCPTAQAPTGAFSPIESADMTPGGPSRLAPVGGASVSIQKTKLMTAAAE